MKLPNPDDLRKLTDKAIIEGKKEHQKQLAEELDKKQKKQIADRKKADKILDDVPKICKEAAAKGKDQAVVLILKSGQYKSVSSPNGSLPYELDAVGKMVWDDLVKANLDPRFYSGWDDNGNTWLEISVNW